MTSRPDASSRVRSRRGMTLIEIMIASLVLVLVLISSFAVMQIAFRTLDDARMSTLAAQIAQSKIENLRLLNWTKIQAMQPSNPSVVNLLSPTNEITTILAGSSNSGHLSRFKFFQLEITNSINPDGGPPRSKIKTLRVTLRWEGLRKELHERVFEANYAENGVFDYDYTVL